ncbi:PIN domain-containing protein [Thermatribacter velox]|uniref:PIN domain-containing protein n=1 Tax=Thermatribacter velox TaxID=3039681 RepID=A0ABZ2Y958_9BACT
MPSERNTVIVDANVILRYLLKDDPKLYKKAEEFFDEVFSGLKKALFLQSVIAEVIYVLRGLYNVKREEIAEVLEEFSKMKGVKIQDKDVVLEALHIFKSKNLDFVDCLLCAYSRKYVIFTLDKGVEKCIEKL